MKGSAKLKEWMDREREVSRGERGTQGWLAAELGVHQATVSKWLAGQQRVELANALAVARLTGIPVEDWVEEEHSPIGADDGTHAQG